MKGDEHHLDFLMVPVPCLGGGERYVVLGFQRDGTMWVDPREFGIGPLHAPQLARSGPGYLLINPATKQVLLNARAVVEVKTDPDWRREWLSFVEDMSKHYKQVRAHHEATRNN